MEKVTKAYRHTLTFRSPIGLERSITPNVEQLSDDTESNIEICINEDGTGWFEWDVPDLDIGEAGGLEFEGNSLTGYDGVFELPKQLIEHLKEQGYDCSEIE